MPEVQKKLEWDNQYNVGVVELDNQHKGLFAIINELIDAIESNSEEEHLQHIIDSIIRYKRLHFSTEERYFKEFNYEETEIHMHAHEMFNKKIAEIQKQNEGNAITFSFALVDFLEDWLIEHLMTVDQHYKKCFQEHGLK